MFSTAKNRLIKITPKGLIAHDHGHQHSVEVKLVGHGGHKPLVQAEHLQHTRQAADRAATAPWTRASGFLAEMPP